MKVAILISGYLRSFKQNLDNFKENILSQYNVENIDLYIHVTKNENQDDRYYNEHNNLIADIQFIEDNLNPICLLVEPNINPYSHNNVSNQWQKYYKLNKIKKLNELELGFRYDVVIKLRPDMFFIDKPNLSMKNNYTIYIPRDAKVDKSKFNNLNEKYLCDIFAFGTSYVMDDYFEVYLNTKNNIDEKASEVLLYEHLVDGFNYELIDINYKIILSKCNIIALSGDSGSGKTTLSNILKDCFKNSFKIECDRYHRFERHDENWKNYTHLNPEANLLEKMNNDIFDLKVGKTIYHVDYDHKTGKFTDTQTIEPEENIIVCGLHTLYGDNIKPYNLKIFVDTQEDLKARWKINRDVIERGYSLEKVLNQIESRKEDYQKYILPQREFSDLIINFYINSNNINNNDNNIGLRLFVNKNFNITDILKNSNINLVGENENWYRFDFKEYVHIELIDHNIPLRNDFYDYVLYFIFKMM